MDGETEMRHFSRGKGRGRGRGKKKAVENDIKTQEPTSIIEGHFTEQGAITLDLDADITQLEAPTFSTINKGPSEPMLRLSWDHKTHLIGEKVINPMIHCCDKCGAPILIYGRMIPCKHVFCLACAECNGKMCPRCKEKVVRIEKTGLGSVFMCTFGGTRYNNTGCRRTYLSQRDLQAHINHRHVTSGAAVNKDNSSSPQVTLNMKPLSSISCRVKSVVTYPAAAVGDPRIHTSNNESFHNIHDSPSSHTSPSSQQSRQSHHHSFTMHRPEHHHHQTVQNSGCSHQQFSSLQIASSQRHLSSNPQILQSPADFVNQVMMPSYMQNNASSLNSAVNLSSNLISIHGHESNTDTGYSSIALAPRGSNFHQSYSPQLSQTSSPDIPFPVPPPGQQPMKSISQAQYFSNSPLTYQSTTQRATVLQLSPNPAAQSMMNQHSTMPASTTLRRQPFSSGSAIQPFPVPPPLRWPQPSQSNHTHFY